MAKKELPPTFPDEQRICGILFVCQLVAVLSSVALVYLTVAVYAPAFRALNSGIVDAPVMCTTVQADDTVELCEWASCGEWCLSKSSGLCMHIWVSVRENGSALTLSECSSTVDKVCVTGDSKSLESFNCRKDQCKKLEGLFNCTAGICTNVTDAFTCRYTSSEQPVRCLKKENCYLLHGMYTCIEGVCSRLAEPVCERKCAEIPTAGRNVIVLSGDRIFLASCQSVLISDTNQLIFDSSSFSNQVLLISCHQLRNESGHFFTHDCINATVIPTSVLGDKTNHSILLKTHRRESQARRLTWLDAGGQNSSQYPIPTEPELLLINRTRLFVNLEMCVNTLRDECKEFYGIYGRDGRDHRAQSRFPCHYTPLRNDMVVSKFDRRSTAIEFALFAAIPGFLFVVSCTCLIVCTKVVAIGPDAHMILQINQTPSKSPKTDPNANDDLPIKNSVNNAKIMAL